MTAVVIPKEEVIFLVVHQVATYLLGARCILSDHGSDPVAVVYLALIKVLTFQFCVLRLNLIGKALVLLNNYASILDDYFLEVNILASALRDEKH